MKAKTGDPKAKRPPLAMNDRVLGARSSRKVVLIIEPGNKLFRLLASENGFMVCGTVHTLKQAHQALFRNRPDLVLADITRDERPMLKFIESIRAVTRGARVLAISSGSAQAKRALQAGANGCISVSEDSDEIAFAVRDVLAGHIYVSEQLFLKKEESCDTRTRRSERAFAAARNRVSISSVGV